LHDVTSLARLLQLIPPCNLHIAAGSKAVLWQCRTNTVFSGVQVSDPVCCCFAVKNYFSVLLSGNPHYKFLNNHNCSEIAVFIAFLAFGTNHDQWYEVFFRQKWP
jgi:hypothetical protein